jgi:hypothetical protein
MQSTSEVQNLSVSIDKDFAAAYTFLAQPENFAHWASGLGTLHRENERWITETPEGRMVVRFSPHNPYGVLDHWVTPPEGADIYIPLRLIANGSGCELILTLLRQPDMDDARFAADADWVRRDLLKAKRVLETPSAQLFL